VRQHWRIVSRRNSFGVTPAIATMVLLSATLVLALVFGAYSFSLFRPNVNHISLTTVVLTDGVTTDNLTIAATASLQITLRNPDLNTTLSSIRFSENGQNPLTTWSISSSPGHGNSFLVNGQSLVSGGRTTSLTLYPVSSPSVEILPGATYDYIISFSNGQSISGALIAQ
jgi:hypothetical protein